MKKSILLLTALFSLFNFISEAKEKTPPLHLKANVTEISCHDAMDGKIELSISGGVAPYIVVWDNGKSDLVMSGLRDGEYSVKVVDARGKEEMLEFNLTNPEPIFLELNTTEQRFIDDLGVRVNLSLKGGTPYEIEGTDWYDIAIETNNLYSGSETSAITVVDSRGCTASKIVQLNVIRKQNNSDNILNIIVENNDIPLFENTNDISSTNAYTYILPE